MGKWIIKKTKKKTGNFFPPGMRDSIYLEGYLDCKALNKFGTNTVLSAVQNMHGHIFCQEL